MKYLVPFIFVAFIHTTIINIPGDYSTIQEGINNSVDGDMVLVSPGTYFENINFNGKNISLIGENRETTTIDGGQNGSVVTFQSGETSAAILRHFRITNGNADSGGGISCVYSSPTLDNLEISNNHANYNGAGIYCDGGSSPLTLNTIITQNSSGENGGGISIFNSAPQFDEVQIINNSAASDGGGFRWFSATPTLKKVIISGNTAPNGAGISCWDNSNSSLTNVVIINNTASITGGGLFIRNNSHPVLLNSIVWGNSPQQATFDNSFSMSNIAVEYTDFQNGANGISGYNGNINWLTGNIDSNPLFTDSGNGDFSLQPNSPCIDVGDPDFDNDGISWENDPDDQDPDGTRMDMGAYYFSQIAGCTDPFAINYNPEATIDDGSCNYEGCTYFQAINYNSDASLDDGSCEFLFADVNFDTIVDILDIVIIVSMIMGD